MANKILTKRLLDIQYLYVLALFMGRPYTQKQVEELFQDEVRVSERDKKFRVFFTKEQTIKSILETLLRFDMLTYEEVIDGSFTTQFHGVPSSHSRFVREYKLTTKGVRALQNGVSASLLTLERYEESIKYRREIIGSEKPADIIKDIMDNAEDAEKSRK
jgi:hypothetical protein